MPSIPDHRRLCGYSITRALGAETFLAADDRGRAIVIKTLDASCLLQGQLHPAVRARLQHVRELPLTHVANLHGVERDGSKSYLIWDYVEGRTLDEFTAMAESPQQRSAVMEEARLSVESLHAAGLVHGAIHAKNVIIDEQGKAHLTHISPLLFYEPQVDIDALGSLGSRTALVVESSAIDHSDRPLRLRFIAGAIGVAVIGGLVAMLIAMLIH